MHTIGFKYNVLFPDKQILGKQIFVWLFILFICLLFFDKKDTKAAHVTLHRDIYFGSIIAAPGITEIDINAQNGEAVSQVVTPGSNTLVKNGLSGLIRIYSDIPGQQISITYPAGGVTLSDTATPPHTMTYTLIEPKSIDLITSTAKEELDFHIGGRLNITSGQAGASYSGTMTVIITIINPP